MLTMSKFAHRQQGMLMLECMIALVIFRIGVIGLVMMQGIASGNSVNSEDRATAAALANDLIAELWTNGSANPPADLTTWQTTVTAALHGTGAGTLTTTGNQALVTITWTPRSNKATGA